MRLIGNLNEMPSGAQIPTGQLTKPRSCAVIPNRTTDPEGFIDTRNVGPDDTPVFVSVGAVREMGRLVGLVDTKELDALREDCEEQIAEAREQLDSLSHEVDDLQQIEDARDLVAAAEEVAA